MRFLLRSSRPKKAACRRITIVQLLAVGLTVLGTTSVASADIALIEIDVTSGLVLKDIPFDVPWVLKGGLPKDSAPLIRVDTVISPKTSQACPFDFPEAVFAKTGRSWKAQPSLDAKSFHIRMEPIEPNVEYCIWIRYANKPKAVANDQYGAWLRRKLAAGADCTLLTYEDEPGLRRIRADQPLSENRKVDVDDATCGLYADASARSQNLRSKIIPELNSKLKPLVAALNGLQARSRPEGHPDHAMLDVLASSSYDADAIERVAFGESRLGSVRLSNVIPLSEVTDAEQLSSRRENLKTTALAIESLRSALAARGELDGFERMINEAVVTTDAAVQEVSRWQSAINRLNTKVAKGVSAPGTEIVVTLHAPQARDFKTRASAYISADVGLLWSPELSEWSPYVAASITPRPVNMNANYPFISLARLSLLVGATTKSIAEESRRTDLLGKSSLVFGLGYRPTDFVRGSLGGLVYKAADQNPLVDDMRIRVTFILSLSVDVNVAGLAAQARKLLLGI